VLVVVIVFVVIARHRPRAALLRAPGAPVTSLLGA
jgi:hypothetical protein